MGTTQCQEFKTSGSHPFTVPANVSLIWLTMIGGGGGGGGNRTNSGASNGAGAGECAVRVPMKVTPGATVTINVGAVGSGGSGDNQGFDGGNTSVGAYVANGGHLGTTLGGGVGGAGGGWLGVPTVFGIAAVPGVQESVAWFCGAAGGEGASGTSGNGFGGGAAGYNLGGANPDPSAHGGGGGGSTLWARGTSGGTNGTSGVNAPGNAFGVGGGGAGSDPGIIVLTGGNGGVGYVLVDWVGD